MKLFIILAVTALCNGAKLDRTYLPPNAQNSGGSDSILQTPLAEQPLQNQPLRNVPLNNFARNDKQTVASGFGPANEGNVYTPGINGIQNSQYEAGFNNLGGFEGKPERAQAAFERNAAILRQSNDNDGERYSYAYETENGIYAEENAVATNGVEAEGGFSYTGDDGKIYSIRYTADQNGFVPQGEHLPTPPPVPEEILKALEQNARDEAAGIYDDGSYSEAKYASDEAQGYNLNANNQYSSSNNQAYNQYPSSNNQANNQYPSANNQAYNQYPSSNNLANNQYPSASNQANNDAVVVNSVIPSGPSNGFARLSANNVAAGFGRTTPIFGNDATVVKNAAPVFGKTSPSTPSFSSGVPSFVNNAPSSGNNAPFGNNVPSFSNNAPSFGINSGTPTFARTGPSTSPVYGPPAVSGVSSPSFTSTAPASETNAPAFGQRTFGVTASSGSIRAETEKAYLPPSQRTSTQNGFGRTQSYSERNGYQY